MKTLFVTIAIIFASISVYAADKIPERFQGEWCVFLASKDDHTFTQASTSIGVMHDDKMMAFGQVRSFEDVVYNERYQTLTISFKDSPTIWIVQSHSQGRATITVYHIENKVSLYKETLLIDIYN